MCLEEPARQKEQVESDICLPGYDYYSCCCVYIETSKT